MKATMPVESRTHQPMGILYGGASVVLAEPVGNFAAKMAVLNLKNSPLITLIVFQ